MKKIGIIVKEETSFKCSGGGCLKAFFDKRDAFSEYDTSTQLLSMTHSGGNMEKKIARMKKNGITTVHISTCLSKEEELTKELMGMLKGFDVVIGTHGKKK